MLSDSNIQKIISFVCSELPLKPEDAAVLINKTKVSYANLVLKNEDKSIINSTACGVMFLDFDGLFHILIDASITAASQISALIHEIIHCWQIQRGDLEISKTDGPVAQDVIWKGKKYLISDLAYREHEWEKEAKIFEQILFFELLMCDLGLDCFKKIS